MRCVGRERVPRQDCKRREANDKSKPDLHRYSTEARPLRLSRLRQDGAQERALGGEISGESAPAVHAMPCQPPKAPPRS
jgi:hypothetical protein